MRQEFVPSNDKIYGWIEEIFAQGIRRPAYPADQWVERYCLERFRSLGMENVRAEPVEVPCWEPRDWSLTVWSDGAGSSKGLELDCFPLPHSAPTAGLEGRLVPYDPDAPETVKGNISLHSIALMRIPHSFFTGLASWHYDPENTSADSWQVVPFPPERQEMMDLPIAAGALGFVGALTDYPSDSHEYYVPYHGVTQPIPGVWISGSDGARLAEMLAAGPVHARLKVDSVCRTAICNNIVGELQGPDDELVIIGSHHDAPWASAVEDTSGVALALAQAEYWSRVPKEERPHSMLFVLHAGHMVHSAGAIAFIKTHQADAARTVLEVHLEHAALECTEDDGQLKPTGHPEARWWFVSRIPQLEASVREAIEAEELTRSLILPPTVFGEYPPTDGARFFQAGVPLVSFLAAPFYLFDSQDTMDKVDRQHLAAITRAAIRIVESSRGVTAKAMRERVQTT
jgi:hypothetical protein